MQQRAARKRTVSAPYQIGVEENFFNIITDSDEIPFSSILSIADTKIILDSGIDINIHDDFCNNDYPAPNIFVSMRMYMFICFW